MGLMGAGSEKLCDHGYRRETCQECSYNWLNDQLHQKDDEISRLKEEVERLREEGTEEEVTLRERLYLLRAKLVALEKAGDAMAKAWDESDWYNCPVREEWDKAKGGE